jgi:hypothetical protein
MSDDNPNRPRTLGGGNSDQPVPSSWPRPDSSSHPRVGRTGGRVGGGTSCVSYHIIKSFSAPEFSCRAFSGSGRRFATLGDDNEDGDDEQQNYFAGGERR